MRRALVSVLLATVAVAACAGLRSDPVLPGDGSAGAGGDGGVALADVKATSDDAVGAAQADLGAVPVVSSDAPGGSPGGGADAAAGGDPDVPTATATASCQDNQKNGSETDIDCGGACAKCASGRTCSVPDDCLGGFCNSKRCGVCLADDRGCSDNRPQTCSADGTWSPGPPCASPTPLCRTGQCVTPSCQSGGDSPYVVGGTYARSFDGIHDTDDSKIATVSDFRMDRYEITVGRFREFLAAYPANRPAGGAGRHPRLGDTSGWRSAYDATLPSAVGPYTAVLKCGEFTTWTDSPGPNENKPINCITWYDAFAFCAWDGGRLPTEAEWNYVAAFGNGACPYPWRDCVPIEPQHAVFGCVADGSAAGDCSANDILAVGSRSPKGDARWNQADVSGNVAEWVLDAYSPTYILPCDDCANLSYNAYGVIRGGSFLSEPLALTSGRRESRQLAARGPDTGARCVRAP
jgi:sulfatase modifying factor 1